MKSNTTRIATQQTHVNQFLKSGLTRRAYCQKYGIKLPTFNNWYYRHTTRDNPTKAIKPSFAPVVITPSTPNEEPTQPGKYSYKIYYHQEILIELPPTATASDVVDVLTALRVS